MLAAGAYSWCPYAPHLLRKVCRIIASFTATIYTAHLRLFALHRHALKYYAETRSICTAIDLSERNDAWQRFCLCNHVSSNCKRVTIHKVRYPESILPTVHTSRFLFLLYSIDTLETLDAEQKLRHHLRRRLSLCLIILITVNFCHATLCIARRTPSCGVCLSVRPCVTFVYCIETRKHFPKLVFTVWWAHNSSFIVSNVAAIFRRGIPKGGVECRRVWRNRDFRPISHLISELNWTFIRK